MKNCHRKLLAYLLVSLAIVCFFVVLQMANTTSSNIHSNLPSYSDSEPSFNQNQMLVSQLCTEAQFKTDTYKYWCNEIKQKPTFHRKQWEFVYILQALSERGMLQPNKKGVGFGVGREPLPAVFAKYGVEVLATDLDLAAAQKSGWVASKQHLNNIALLNNENIVSKQKFDALIKTREVDMRNIPTDIRGYDFTWSSCALEHLGNIEKGLQFIEDSLETLVPGGVAVHTTEFNLSSNENTITEGNTVLFRKQDIQKLVSKLQALGHEVYVNYNPGHGALDAFVDLPPYKSSNHLKLQIEGYKCTSIGLIIKKNNKNLFNR